MTYKDKDKQREAVKEATRRYRARKQGITQQPVSVIPVIPNQLDLSTIREIIKNDPTQGRIAGELTKARQVSRKGFRHSPQAPEVGSE